MQNGRRIAPAVSLAQARAHAARELERLPETVRSFDETAAYPVRITDALIEAAAEVDRRLLADEGEQ